MVKKLRGKRMMRKAKRRQRKRLQLTKRKKRERRKRSRSLNRLFIQYSLEGQNLLIEIQ